MPLLSIIIPVYNVEKYLSKCLNSIFTQDFSKEEFEVIIVVDGSLDNSINIANKFRNHLNCKIIEQPNQGLSLARNNGLRQAKGKYIWFVDSDDYISDNSLQILKENLTKYSADIIGINIIKTDEITAHQTLESPFISRRCIYNKYYEGSQLQKRIQTGAVQRFIFKHSFLKKYNLQFYPKIYHEDTEFLIKAIFFSRQVLFLNENLYYYLIRESGSIMSQIKIKSFYDTIQIINNWIVFKQKYAKNLRQRAAIWDSIFYEINWIVSNLKKHKTQYKEFINSHYYKMYSLSSKAFFLSFIPYFTLGKIGKYVVMILTLLRLNNER